MIMNLPLLLPQPKHLTQAAGYVALPLTPRILLKHAPQELLFSATQLQKALKETGVSARISASATVVGDITLQLSGDISHPEGYTLSITPDRGIVITAQTACGVFYGVQTLIQLWRQAEGGKLGCLEIDDVPDFAHRGLMFDVSRSKVPKLETLKGVIDLLAHLKVNHLQLYIEHTFAYAQHPLVWRDASPITPEDILILDAYCQERHIELVANQNCFGHMEPWLRHEPYAHLSEVDENFQVNWGLGSVTYNSRFSLDISNPESLEFVATLWPELLPNFSSNKVNINCDETFDLGQGKSRALCEEKGKGRAYLDFLLSIYEQVSQQHGKEVLYWGDIIGHYPELIPELPKDAIALEWGYEATHPFAKTTEAFAESGVPFWVCPGTGTWVTTVGRTDNCLTNIQNAVSNGLKHGATGVLNTDWGDWGHHQQLPVSYLGYAYGAAASWGLEASKALDLPKALDLHIFRDEAGVMGQVVYDLGNIYQIPEITVHNGNFFTRTLYMPLDGLKRSDTSEVIKQYFESRTDLKGKAEEALERTHHLSTQLSRARLTTSDGDMVADEYLFSADLLAHGCQRLITMLDPNANSIEQCYIELGQLAERYQTLWLRRNRPGGLSESVAKLTRVTSASGVSWHDILLMNIKGLQARASQNP